MYTVTISNEALFDMQEAYNYLESKESGAGEKLLRQTDEYLSIIELNPYLFKENYKKVRQVNVKPFRYLLRYKIYKTRIVVIQLFHGNLNPNKAKH